LIGLIFFFSFYLSLASFFFHILCSDLVEQQRELSGTGQGKGDINAPVEVRRDSTIAGGMLLMSALS
jgi:hypothetical protein